MRMGKVALSAVVRRELDELNEKIFENHNKMQKA
jgi:hypothetical protein